MFKKNFLTIAICLFFVGYEGGGESIDTIMENNSSVLKSQIVSQIEPYYYRQWYLDYNKIFYDENGIDKDANVHIGDYLKKYNGDGIKIAVIDDGLDIKHEDLVGAITKTFDIAAHSTNVAHTNIEDFHETAVTGIIGARVNGRGIRGIACKAKIIFLKYKDRMSDSEIVELFNKAKEFRADIINCSCGTYDASDVEKEKIKDLAKNRKDGKGIIIVFAAGNDNKDIGNDESAIPEVISVSTTDEYNERATTYSNYGPNLNLLAPGGYEFGIITIDDMNNKGKASINKNYILYNNHNCFAGTSDAAPIVIGVIALMLEKNPNLTREEVENILKQSCDKIGNIEYKNGRNDYYGYGKINLTKIMRKIK